MKRTCIQCGKEFELTGSEIAFYKGKNLSLPKRCKDCRTANKQNRENGKKEETEQVEVSMDVAGEKVSGQAMGSTAAEALSQVRSAQPEKKGHKLFKTIAATMVVIVLGLFGWLGGKNDSETPDEDAVYAFRSEAQLQDHYDRHGVEMGYETPEAYVEAANKVVTSPDVLHKLEAEDGDDVYYLEETNEFVIISQDGYLRTYFWPEDGKDYFDRQ